MHGSLSLSVLHARVVECYSGYILSCCELHPFLPVLTKQKGPRGWDGRKPAYYTDEHWGVSVKGRQVCEGMWADRVSADNYAWLLGHEIHGTSPGVLRAEVVIDG